MKHRIFAVEPGSIADQLGLRAGDVLMSIGDEKIADWIDYQALCSSKKLSLTTLRDGEIVTYSFEKDEYEPLGLAFEEALMSGQRNCANKCIFCFVDQLPADVRGSLAVKDDDWRLSLMMGNFVTLTNVGDRELQRIIARRAAPLYISVHTTDGALRARMLGNPRGAHIMEQLKSLADAGLSFYAQIVLVRGVNDGPALDSTIDTLAAMYPACTALAVVPVGLTAHRAGLNELKPYDADSAAQVLDQIDRHRAKIKAEKDTYFVHAADEFYVLSGRAVPEESEYEGYPLYENGIGMIRRFTEEYIEAWREGGEAAPAKVAVLTGISFAGVLSGLLEKYPVPGVQAQVFPVENRFFAGRVTVAGLLTGSDLLDGGVPLAEFDRVLIPDSMLRADEDVFLDGMTLEQLNIKMDGKIRLVGVRGEDLVRALLTT